MVKSYEQLFEMMPLEEPPVHMCEQVASKVEKTEISRLRARVAFHASLAVATIAGGIVMTIYLVQGMRQSGLNMYASLLITDGSFIVTHWKELALSIADSTPLVSAIITAALLLILLNSLRLFIQYRISLSRHAAYFL